MAVAQLRFLFINVAVLNNTYSITATPSFVCGTFLHLPLTFTVRTDFEKAHTHTRARDKHCTPKIHNPANYERTQQAVHTRQSTEYIHTV